VTHTHGPFNTRCRRATSLAQLLLEFGNHEVRIAGVILSLGRDGQANWTHLGRRAGKSVNGFFARKRNMYYCHIMGVESLQEGKNRGFGLSLIDV